jgi:hypothetical protein
VGTMLKRSRPCGTLAAVQVPTTRLEIRDELLHGLHAAGAVVRCLGLALFLNLVPILNDDTAHGAEPTNQATSFTVESPRALSQAVLMLIQRYGYVITYEDAPLTYTGDFHDYTSEIHSDLSYLKKSGTVREIAPTRETLTLNLMSSGAMSDPNNMASVIEQILKEHAVLNRGGRFRLQQTEGVFHIVPTEVRDARGEWVSHGSLLNAAITIPEIEGPSAMLLDAICAAVSKATHTHVLVGHVPMNAVADYRGVLAANGEPARNVLLRMLNGTERKFSWMLDYAPAMQQYYLSIVLVPDRAVPAAPVRTVPPESTSSVAVVPWNPGR